MTARTRIKVCGMTRKSDIDAAIAFGVDAIGVIFAKESPRYIDPEEARNILVDIPPFVDTVGVFCNEDPEIVAEIVQYCGLSFVQLHGTEPPEYCEAISAPVIKAFRVKPEMTANSISAYRKVVSGYLLDSYRKGVAGGTGEVFDWNLVKELSPPGPIILAGGIDPENVGQAVTEVRPFAIDANSGVESAPGKKDPERIKHLISEIRYADERFTEAQ